MPTYTVFIFIALVVVGAIVAWIGDALGARLGKQRASIFEPFYQADSSTTRAFGGTGLGLSLAKSYVVAHGGFLWLDSSDRRGESSGSAFTFSLPAVPEISMILDLFFISTLSSNIDVTALLLKLS